MALEVVLSHCLRNQRQRVVGASDGRVTADFPNYCNRVESSSVNHHALDKYLGLSVGSELMYLLVRFWLHLLAISLVATFKRTCVFLSPCSELTSLPVGRFHLRTIYLVAKCEQGEGTGYMDEAIDPDRKTLEHWPPGHPNRSVPLTWLTIHLGDHPLPPSRSDGGP